LFTALSSHVANRLQFIANKHMQSPDASVDDGNQRLPTVVLIGGKIDLCKSFKKKKQ
jgi:hypothetical protein